MCQHIEEKDLAVEDSEALDSIFSLSNGVFCARGTLPFGTQGKGGIFYSGLYTEAPAELTWIPDISDPARDSENYLSDEEIGLDEDKKAELESCGEDFRMPE